MALKNKKLEFKAEEPQAYTNKNSVVFWKSTITGFTSHGSLISSDAAKYAAESANRKYPFIKHVVVTLTNTQLSMINDTIDIEDSKDALDQYSPFKPK